MYEAGVVISRDTLREDACVWPVDVSCPGTFDAVDWNHR